ncbi:Gfo/Idh/MocA family oxidoreductase [Gammaproteobacteria bacterium]|nr:Gfo/Idh/MocA family oxidoreductase [Gammaproteobacteria bacterium]
MGAGFMAKEYLSAIKELNLEACAVSASSKSADAIKNKFGYDCYSGGYSKFTIKPDESDIAIVCVPSEILAECTKHLIELGFKRILLEKPGALYIEDLANLEKIARAKKCNVSIAYNRRFFSSVMHLKEILKSEKLIAVDFEITEWTHLINPDDYSQESLARWFISNTSHVTDLAFNIAGTPDELSCYTSGKLPWHSSSSRFSGSGRTVDNVLISYKGYWDAPGRWSLEFITNENRYFLRPMEKLFCQKKGSIDIVEVDGIDYSDDEICKPGVLKMLSAYLTFEDDKFCSLTEQIARFEIYCKMASYD